MLTLLPLGHMTSVSEFISIFISPTTAKVFMMVDKYAQVLSRNDVNITIRSRNHLLWLRQLYF